MNFNSQTVLEGDGVQEILTAPREISALELVSTGKSARSRQITSVPKGACLTVCGDGFNERTVQVHWEGKLYYVFLQDVEPVKMPATSLRR